MSDKKTAPVSLEPVQMSVRLWPGLDRDLIVWLRSLDDLPHGRKGERIKATLRQGIETDLHRLIKSAIEEAVVKQEG